MPFTSRGRPDALCVPAERPVSGTTEEPLPLSPAFLGTFYRGFAVNRKQRRVAAKLGTRAPAPVAQNAAITPSIQIADLLARGSAIIMPANSPKPKTITDNFSRSTRTALTVFIFLASSRSKLAAATWRQALSERRSHCLIKTPRGNLIHRLAVAQQLSNKFFPVLARN